MLTLSSLLNAVNKEIEATAVCNQAVTLAESILASHDEDTPDADKKRVSQLYMEFLKVQYNTFGSKKLMMDQFTICKKLVEFSQKVFGDASEELADSKYLLSKSQYTMGETDESLHLVREAINIQMTKELNT